MFQTGYRGTAVLLNGSKGSWFRHYRGLRQGDPLSPMLFIIAMEPLQKLFDIAAAQGLLSPLAGRNANFRASLYADDAAIFLNPVKEKVQVAADLLQIFAHASGLFINQSKCAVYPIACEAVNLEEVMQGFPCQVKGFPCQYLGLPLRLQKL